MEYRITVEHIKTGVKECVETDNTVILHSHEINGRLSWSVLSHIQPAVLMWILSQPAIQGLLSKLDLTALLGKFISSKFAGGQK